jgi:hypothetical protein
LEDGVVASMGAAVENAVGAVKDNDFDVPNVLVEMVYLVAEVAVVSVVVSTLPSFQPSGEEIVDETSDARYFSYHWKISHADFVVFVY